MPSESIDERFQKFHGANQHVYEGLLRLALEAKASGYKRYAVEELYAVLRWSRMKTTGDRDFKLNDHFTSRYARMLMQLNPQLDGFFETRRLRSAEPKYGKPPHDQQTTEG